MCYHTAQIIDKIGMPGAVYLVVKKYAELVEWPFLFNEEYQLARCLVNWSIASRIRTWCYMYLPATVIETSS